MTERSARPAAAPDVERLLGSTSWLAAGLGAALAVLARPPRQRVGIHGF
jgi:hypothetical protein